MALEHRTPLTIGQRVARIRAATQSTLTGTPPSDTESPRGPDEDSPAADIPFLDTFEDIVPFFDFQPFDNIPFDNIPFDNVPFDNIPFDNIPFDNIPFEDLPFLDLPFEDVSFVDIPFLDIPFEDVPFLDIPFNDFPFDNVPFDNIPFADFVFEDPAIPHEDELASDKETVWGQEDEANGEMR